MSFGPISTIPLPSFASPATLVSSISGAASSAVGNLGGVTASLSGFSNTLGGAQSGNVANVSLPSVTITGHALGSHKVRIKGPGGFVTFEASSPVTESRSATYTGMDITHLPTALQTYRNTGARKWSVSGKLVSRNVAEANRNARYLDLVRSWIMPEFGTTGATPPILRFYAYKNVNIAGRQVILTSYDWMFPDDVDYIYQGDQPMPIIGMMTLNLEEVYSAEQVTNGEWKMQGAEDTADDGSPTGLLGSDSTLTSPGGLMQQLGSFSPNLTNQLSGALSSIGTPAGAPNLLGAVAGSLTKSLGTNILNDPRVTTVLGGVPAPLKSVLTAGASGVITDLTRGVTTTVSAVTTTIAPVDPFRTASPLAPPSLVGAEPRGNN